MNLCGVCADGHPSDRQAYRVCDGCAVLTECAVVDPAPVVPIAPRCVPPTSGLVRLATRLRR